MGPKGAVGGHGAAGECPQTTPNGKWCNSAAQPSAGRTAAGPIAEGSGGGSTNGHSGLAYALMASDSEASEPEVGRPFRAPLRQAAAYSPGSVSATASITSSPGGSPVEVRAA